MATVTKICTGCSRSLPLAAYHKAKRGVGGVSAQCRDCRSEYSARRYLANRERIRSQVDAWQAANRERFLGGVSAYSRANQAARTRRFAMRRALISQYPEFSEQALHARLAMFGSKCWMCGGEFQHLDHVKPLSKGGPHLLANLRPACARCNTSKGARWFGPQSLSVFLRQ